MKQNFVLVLLVSSFLFVQIICEYQFSYSVYCQTSDNVDDSFGSSPTPYTDWDRTYGGFDTEAASAMIQTQDGGYAIAGIISVVPDDSDFLALATDSFIFITIFGIGVEKENGS